MSHRYIELFPSFPKIKQNIRKTIKPEQHLSAVLNLSWEQEFSTLHSWPSSLHFWPSGPHHHGLRLVGPVHCRRFGSLPGLNSVNASSTLPPPTCTDKCIFRDFQMSPGGQNWVLKSLSGLWTIVFVLPLWSEIQDHIMSVSAEWSGNWEQMSKITLSCYLGNHSRVFCIPENFQACLY